MNDKRYFGKVCAKHPELAGERHKANGTCTGCARASSKLWKALNPGKVLAQRRARLSASPEARRKAAERHRAWRAANPEMHAANGRAWAAANPEKRAKVVQAWSKNNRDKRAVGDARRRARKADALVPLTWFEKNQIRALYDIAKARTAQTGEQHNVDHDVPLARGGKHHPDNMHVLLASVNSAKGARYENTAAFFLRQEHAQL